MNSRSLPFVFPLVVLILAACTSHSTQQMVVVQPPAAKAGSVPAPRPFGTAPAPEQPIRATAVSGVPLRVAEAFSVNADCTSAGVSKATLVTSPSHGKIAIEETNGYPNYAPRNQRYDCNKIREPGIIVHYTADNNYIGTDTFTLSFLSPTGNLIQRVYIMKVQSLTQSVSP